MKNVFSALKPGILNKAGSAQAFTSAQAHVPSVAKNKRIPLEKSLSSSLRISLDLTRACKTAPGQRVLKMAFNTTSLKDLYF